MEKRSIGRSHMFFNHDKNRVPIRTGDLTVMSIMNTEIRLKKRVRSRRRVDELNKKTYIR